jgi:hypothetical protein
MTAYSVQHRSTFGPNPGELRATVELETAVRATRDQAHAAPTDENIRRRRALLRLYAASCGESWKCLAFGYRRLAPTGRPLPDRPAELTREPHP